MVNTAMNHSSNPWLLWIPDHRIDLTTFKTQVKSRAADEWFHCKVLNILFTSFLIVHRSVHHQIAVYLAFFTITLTIIRSTFRQSFLENRAQEIEKNKLRLISFVYTLTKYAIHLYSLFQATENMDTITTTLRLKLIKPLNFSLKNLSKTKPWNTQGCCVWDPGDAISLNVMTLSR